MRREALRRLLWGVLSDVHSIQHHVPDGFWRRSAGYFVRRHTLSPHSFFFFILSKFLSLQQEWAHQVRALTG
jgi:hypothetical protein